MGHAEYRTGAEPLSSESRASDDAFARFRASFNCDFAICLSIASFPPELLEVEAEAAEVYGREPNALLLDSEQRLGARLSDVVVEGVGIAHLSFASTPISLSCSSLNSPRLEISPALAIDCGMEKPLDREQLKGLEAPFE
jgi:hypothetical protein